MESANNNINGVINLYKQPGITSQTAVNKVKRLLNIKKCGHAGTLDPMAEGILLILLGSATKCSELLMSEIKEYEVSIKLGITTDTYDIEGTVIKEVPREQINVTSKLFENTLKSFLGESYQLPPMHSAVQVNGVRLYKLARKGLTIEREPRKINIYDITPLEFNEKELSARFSVTCSKGTYIRSLVSDIGEKLGCGGVMTRLIRNRSGEFNLKSSVDFENLQQSPQKYIIPTEKCFPHLNKYYIQSFYLKLLRDGQRVLQNKLHLNLPENELCLVYSEDKSFAGIGRGVMLKDGLGFELFKKL